MKDEIAKLMEDFARQELGNRLSIYALNGFFAQLMTIIDQHAISQAMKKEG